MNIQLRHVGIVVSDLPKMQRFWTEVMGFQEHLSLDESGPFIDNLLNLNDVDLRTVKLVGSDGQMIELLDFKSHRDTETWDGHVHKTGLTHLAFTVVDLTSLVKRLEKNGAKPINQPQLSPDGNAIVVYVRGPEGLLLELVEPQKRGE